MLLLRALGLFLLPHPHPTTSFLWRHLSWGLSPRVFRMAAKNLSIISLQPSEDNRMSHSLSLFKKFSRSFLANSLSYLTSQTSAKCPFLHDKKTPWLVSVLSSNVISHMQLFKFKWNRIIYCYKFSASFAPATILCLRVKRPQWLPHRRAQPRNRFHLQEVPQPSACLKV
jgi:hypothetical protein